MDGLLFDASVMERNSCSSYAKIVCGIVFRRQEDSLTNRGCLEKKKEDNNVLVD